MIRFLRVLLRGIRPIRRSLDLIATDLHTLTRIQLLRLSADGLALPDEHLLRHPRREDQTELSWFIKEPEINPETGKPVVEDESWDVDLSKIFGGR